MLKWSIFTILSDFFSHLPFVMNHHKHLSCFMTTASSFPVILWPWMNIKVIQTGIKLQSLVVFSILRCLKQTSQHTMMLNIWNKRPNTQCYTYMFKKSCQKTSTSWIVLVQKKNLAWAATNQQIVATCWITHKSICKKMDTSISDFSYKGPE